eukprot:Rmarinus@m.8546
MYNYVVSAQKPTVVTHTAVGNFTRPDELNLLVGRCTRIGLYRITSNGLEVIYDVGIYGRISVMKLFRPPGENKDILFLSTERCKICILEWDEGKNEIITRANGDLSDHMGRRPDKLELGGVDPNARLVALHLYEGLLQIIPCERAPSFRPQDSFKLRIDVKKIIDLQLLHGCEQPTIAVLYEDHRDHRHLKTYEISLRDKDMLEGSLSQRNVEMGTSCLLPVPQPFGGVILIGQSTMSYHKAGMAPVTKSLNSQVFIGAWGIIDMDGTGELRYLLGDHLGQLYVLSVKHSDETVVDLICDWIGETSIASAISYLDNGVIYIGSAYGDSQLARLQESSDGGSNVEVLDTHPNIGPICDLCVVNVERQGQGHVVTCSGGFKDGSLRIIRSGIGINEQASVDLPGIKGIWSLRESTDAVYDKYLVQTIFGETRILGLIDESLEQVEIPGFADDEQTIFCKNVLSDQIVQVTHKRVRLLSCTTLQCVNEWTPPEGMNINVADGNSCQLLLATGGGNVVYIEIEDGKLAEKGHHRLDSEVSSLSINPLGQDEQRANVCACGTWSDFSVYLFRVPTLEQCAVERLGDDVIARSVLLISMEGVDYLLCAMGDGNLFTFLLSDNNTVLGQKKKITLGTQPTVLRTFRSKGNTHVFACSDRPTVIYSTSRKLVYSNVNVKELSHMTGFHSELFPECLALTTDSELMIGTIDEIQKLHVKNVPLGEQPRRISHQDTTRTLAVATQKYVTGADGEDVEKSFVRLFDDTTFEQLHCLELDQYESALSLESMKFGTPNTHYYVLGTAISLPDNEEPNKGRIVILEVVDGKLHIVAERDTKGAVFSVCALNDKLLCGINSRVELYKLSESDDGMKELSCECSHQNHIYALFLATRGDFIAVGDLMKSVSLLVYKPVDQTIEEIAKDFDTKWMTAVEILDYDTIIGAEHCFNLFTARKNLEAVTDEERTHLETSGEYHLGSFVNRFRRGSLVMQPPEVDKQPIQTILFGAVDGTLGLIAILPKDLYEPLLQVQKAMNKVVRGVGGLSHTEWRSFQNEKKTAEALNFLDGDLIESFLDLPRVEMMNVAKFANDTVENIVKKIEDVARLH